MAEPLHSRASTPSPTTIHCVHTDPLHHRLQVACHYIYINISPGHARSTFAGEDVILNSISPISDLADCSLYGTNWSLTSKLRDPAYMPGSPLSLFSNPEVYQKCEEPTQFFMIKHILRPQACGKLRSEQSKFVVS